MFFLREIILPRDKAVLISSLKKSKKIMDIDSGKFLGAA